MKIDFTERLAEDEWPRLAAVYQRTPLGARDPQRLREVFENSRQRRFLYLDGQLCGAARALSDGFDCAVVCDVVVAPEHQGGGYGRKLVEALLEPLRSHRKVILYAVPGQQGFYRTLGFRPMTTAMAIFGDPGQAESWGLIAP
ncbi:GNAT family N-acetyltransferase [Endothiovibrio diazotrophicus]